MMTKEQAFDIFAAQWDQLVATTNQPGVTQAQIDDAYKMHDDKIMETLPQVLVNHPGPPPPRRRPL